MIKRGDIVTYVLSGDYGKQRPGVVVQNNLFNNTHASIVVCPITSHLIDAPLFRLTLNPNRQNQLEHASQIMVDKITAISSEKIRTKIGALSRHELQALEAALQLWLDLEKI